MIVTPGPFAVPATVVGQTLVVGVSYALWRRAGRQGRGLAHFGLGRPRSWPRTILLGLIAWFVGSSLTAGVVIPWITQATGAVPDLTAFAQLRGRPEQLLIRLPLIWVVAAFCEELVFRGALFGALRRRLPSTRAGVGLALTLQAALFGVSHAYQGLSGIGASAFMGTILGATVLLAGGGLWPAVLAHGLTDTVSLVAIAFEVGVPEIR